MHSRSGANQGKKRELSALAAAVQPIPTWDSGPRHWWGNRPATALADDQRQLLKDSTATDGVIDGKLQRLAFTIWRAGRHPAANLVLQYARVGCLVLVGRNWTPDKMEAEETKVPHSSSLKDNAISQIQVEAGEKSSEGFANIVSRDGIKQKPLSNLKISPLLMIPHKRRKYRAILDLSFALKVAGWDIPLVN